MHRWLADKARPVLARGSVGHDACVLARPKGREVACTDQVIIGVHCEETAKPEAVGKKAALRALSDLAATAASPRALLLAVRADSQVDERTIRGWINGVSRAGASNGAELCGGDLACSAGPASLCVTALGEYPVRGRPPGRDRAMKGDMILVTGSLGGSRLGRHMRFEARLAAGRRLHFEHGARSLMDVSDGLAWDLYRLARASQLRARLVDVPLHPDARRASQGDGRSAVWHALHDGEDHELIAALPAGSAELAMADTSPELDGLAVIGMFEGGSGLVLDSALTGDGEEVWDPSQGGWRHGG